MLSGHRVQVVQMGDRLEHRGLEVGVGDYDPSVETGTRIYTYGSIESATRSKDSPGVLRFDLPGGARERTCWSTSTGTTGSMRSTTTT